MIEAKWVHETRWYVFLAAKIFGEKIAKNLYKWNGKFYVTGEVPNPYEEEGEK